ncbi:MAG: PQQ-binding-like beta-propeller repeat protein [Candidatus Acidiferrales bacterium]
MPAKLYTIGVHRSNRGVAVYGNTVYVGTLDCHLVALNAITGAVKWDVHVDPNDQGYSMTGAPRVLDGKVIMGVSGGDVGIRGFLAAYDAKTGKLLWRTYTIPLPGEPGSETWGKSMKGVGGGSTWGTGSYDPDLNLIYWGTGNPAPDYNGSDRPGANLYTDSLIALDPGTGKMKWYFQFTPHDTHDWDSIQVPVLFDADVDGKPRKLVAFANRNGFYYVLDRVTGKFVAGQPFVGWRFKHRALPSARQPLRCMPFVAPVSRQLSSFAHATSGVALFDPTKSRSAIPVTDGICFL